MTATFGPSDDQRPARGDHEGPSSERGRRALVVGAELFDGGRHHAAHEVFEEVWLAARRDGREAEAHWWQGLVLCAGALHHRGRGNRTGFAALAARATERLTAALAAAPPKTWWEAACRTWVERWRTLSNDGSPDADPRLGALLEDRSVDPPEDGAGDNAGT